MNRTTCLMLVLTAGVVSLTAFGRPPKSEVIADEFRFDARNLTNTSLWTKVNDTPFVISSQLDALCAMPTTQQREQERKLDPHVATSITVFVNSIGRAAMFTRLSPVFPQGSVIVKQKNGRYDQSNTTLLYTIMTKREAGYNPEVGDWDFSVVNADGKTVEANGRLENCQGCHVRKPSTDFVFRPYLNFN